MSSEGGIRGGDEGDHRGGDRGGAHRLRPARGRFIDSSSGESTEGELPPDARPGVPQRPRLDPDQSVITHLRDLLGFEPGVQLRNLTTESAFSITQKTEEGKYVIEREIGQGGMGRVFLAFDRDLRRQVAVKVIQGRHVENPEALARFVDEAQITGQLEHPGIPPVHELAINQNGEVFFTLKLLRGRTLKEIIRELLIGRRDARRRFSRTKLLQFLLSVCNALHFAHEKGVIHRDVKPENIMIGDYGEVHLMDWGLAKVVTAEVDEYEYDLVEQVESVRHEQNMQTLNDRIQGTVLYMAPEQAQGRPVDRRADIYALGATLYEMLTFLPPRTGGDTNDLLEEARLGLIIPPSQRAPKLRVPAQLEEICLRALEYHPDDRFQTAAELADAIQVYLDGTFEEERRRSESEHLFREASATLRNHEEDKVALDNLRRELDQVESSAGKHPSREVKRRIHMLKGEIDKTEISVAKNFTQAQTLLAAALAANGDNAQARRALGDLYLEKFFRAEKEHRTTDAIFYGGLISQINDGTFDRILKGDGSLHLETEPEGASMELFRVEERDGSLTPTVKIASGRGSLHLPALPMGSYIVDIEQPGFARTRYPVFIGRNQEIRQRVRLYPESSIPAGFAYVPAGPFTRYGDPNVPGTFGYTSEVKLPGFAIGIFPVTCGEYLEFLNQLVLRAPDEAHRRCPRESEKVGQLWEVVDGKFRLPAPGRYPWSARLPVFGVSFEDALAYCEFRRERDGLPFDLPTESEWEKAAKGVDGRFFSWGNGFDNEHCNNYYAREGDAGVVEVERYPLDCSPYGVRGMVGNVSDWCHLESSDRREMAAVRGSNWALTGDPCRLSIRRSTSRTYVSDRFGFRLKLPLES